MYKQLVGILSLSGKSLVPLIRVRGISSPSCDNTDQHTCTAVRHHWTLVKHRRFPVKYETWLLSWLRLCQSLELGSKHTENTAVNLHQLAVQSLIKSDFIILILSAAPTAAQRTPFLLSALSSSTEAGSNVLLKVFGSSNLGLFLSSRGRLFSSDHRIQQMASILSESLTRMCQRQAVDVSGATTGLYGHLLLPLRLSFEREVIRSNPRSA